MKNSTFICGMLMGIPPWGAIMHVMIGIPWLSPIGLFIQLIGLGIIITYAIRKHIEYLETMKRIKAEIEILEDMIKGRHET